MNKIWYGIANFFEFIFEIIKSIGNSMNYFYIVVIFVFLVIWVSKMITHKKNNQEHSSL